MPLTLISEAVFARALSAQKDERMNAEKVLKGPSSKSPIDRETLIADRLEVRRFWFFRRRLDWAGVPNIEFVNARRLDGITVTHTPDRGTSIDPEESNLLLLRFGFNEMLVYMGFVAVGLFYVWKKGILDWANDKGDL